MTILTYLLAASCYILGLGLALFWFTIPQLKEKCRTANKPFTWKGWWECDNSLVIGNLIFGIIAVVCLEEIVKWKPIVADFMKVFYVVLGAFGTTIVQEKWGSFKKGISNLLDVKANIADAVTGGTETVKETIQKGNEATGIDVSTSPIKKD